MNAREQWLAVSAGRVPVEPGWVRTGQVLDDPQCLQGLVTRGARAVAQEHPGASPTLCRTVAAALLLIDWSWGLACVGAGSLAVAGVVPDLSPDSVWLRFSNGRLAGVTVTGERCLVAADHSAADAREVTVVVDLDAALRAQLTDALTPLHAALRATPDPLLRVGPRSMWAAAGDALATALRLQGEDLLPLAERLLQHAPKAWGTHGFEALVDAIGRRHVVRPRSSCCFYYRLPDVAPCLTCPRLTRAQLLDRLVEQPDPT